VRADVRGCLLLIAPTVVVVLAGSAFLLSRGDGDSAQLRALRADPIARYSPPGARQFRTVATPERAGGSFLKQQEARYLRLFAVPEGAGGARAARAVAEAARRAGWEVSEGGFDDSFHGDKRLATGPARLTVVLGRGPEVEPSPTLTISLKHSGGSTFE
jgi:hypothetical protein